MANGKENSESLEFDAYRSDPLAAFVIDKLEWAPWRFGLVFGMLYQLLIFLTYPIYVLQDGGPDWELLGGYSTVATLAASNLVVTAVASGFYIYISKKAGTLYQELHDSKVFVGGTSSIQGIVRGSSGSIEHIHGRALWRSAAVGVAIVVAIVLFVFQPPPEAADAVRSPSPYLREYANQVYSAWVVITTTPGWMTGQSHFGNSIRNMIMLGHLSNGGEYQRWL